MRLTSGSPSGSLVPPDRRVLLRGVLSLDAEGPEDGVRRGHHRHPHPQEEEGRAEEEAGPALHQLLPDHLITQRASQPEPPPDRNQTEGCERAKRGRREPSTAECNIFKDMKWQLKMLSAFFLAEEWIAITLLLFSTGFEVYNQRSTELWISS